MVFKCVPNDLIDSFSLILAELVYMKTDIKVHNVQIMANDFNGFKIASIICVFANCS